MLLRLVVVGYSRPRNQQGVGSRKLGDWGPHLLLNFLTCLGSDLSTSQLLPLKTRTNAFLRIGVLNKTS